MPEMHDHPDVIVFPPLILLTTVAAGVALQWLFPLGILAHWQAPARPIAGAVVVLMGLATLALGRIALMRSGTNVSPLQPTTALVTGGIFRWTRNPLYTGGMIAMTGLSLIFALDWLALLVLPSATVLHYAVVLREERYLKSKFGAAYRSYMARSARYLWSPGFH